jgi:hypothetical protein
MRLNALDLNNNNNQYNMRHLRAEKIIVKKSIIQYSSNKTKQPSKITTL